MSRVLLLMLAVLLSVSCRPGGRELTCNYNAADISTVEGEHTVLAGFAARKGLSTELHQPLNTHCLVFSDGTDKVCFISNDLMEISPDISLEWRKEISEKSGLPLDRIFMHCTHTHSAPRNGGSALEEGGSNWTHKQRLRKTLVETAVKTITDDAAFRPFRMEVGKAQTDININRCERETGPVDRDVQVLRIFEKKTDKPLVAIVNLACHPVCMGSRSLLVSSDYPGVAGRILREAWGGDVFQFTGASGNMDPVRGPRDVGYAEEAGRSLADSIMTIEFSRVRSTGEFKVATDTVRLPFRIAAISPEAIEAHAAEIAAWGVSVSSTWAEDVEGWKELILSRFAEGKIEDTLPFTLGAVNIDGILFFFTQGEPFCEYQTLARRNFPGRTIFFTGYTNGQNSYLPSAHAFAYKKGYEYEIDQMHVYIKAPYPLSENMPAAYSEAIDHTIRKVL